MSDKTKNTIDLKTKALLICGAIACPLFMIAVLIEGAMRPDYNSFLYPLSSLSIGEMGWTQISNFIITGMGFKQLSGFVNFAGVFQRLCISIGWTWITLLSLHILRSQHDYKL